MDGSLRYVENRIEFDLSEYLDNLDNIENNDKFKLRMHPN